MHKLKLSELNLSDAEMLTREELKKVLGGYGGGPGQDWACECMDGTPQTCWVTGQYDANFWFNNCCGYTGPVLGGGGNSDINFCE